MQEIAATQSIDLWLLFPVSAVRRMLPERPEQIPNNWRKRLDIFFGTNEWEKEFYKPSEVLDLFSSEPSFEVDAKFEQIGKYYVKRLKSIFPYVSPNPHILKTERGIPLYMLCFAASNEKGGPIALGIADYILRM